MKKKLLTTQRSDSMLISKIDQTEAHVLSNIVRWGYLQPVSAKK